MNSRNTPNLIIIVICTAIIISMVILLYRNWPDPCDEIQTINASITVEDIGSRIMIGLNADRDSLKFGVVSPYTQAVRKVTLQREKDAAVTITMRGDLNRWTVISPSQFNVTAQEIKEIAFTVDVPENAPDGNYTGVAVFCIRDA